MYNKKDVADWILQANPIMLTNKSSIYRCTNIQLTDEYTGKLITLAIQDISTVIPLVLSNQLDNHIEKITSMTALLNNSEKLLLERPIIHIRAKEIAPRKPSKPHKKHNWISRKEVQEIEQYFQTVSPKHWDTQAISSTYDISRALISHILHGNHRHSSLSYNKFLKDTAHGNKTT